MTTLKWVQSCIRWQRSCGAKCNCSLLQLFWVMFWWPDEDSPRWWRRVCLVLRRVWYRDRRHPCTCPGCEDTYPAYWAGEMCWCCADEDCCHDEAENERTRR